MIFINACKDFCELVDKVLILARVMGRLAFWQRKAKIIPYNICIFFLSHVNCIVTVINPSLCEGTSA